MATERLTPPYPVGHGTTCIDVLKALPLAEYRFKKAGWIEQDFSGLIEQWSYQNNAIDASSTTHNGGGVFDVDYTMVDTDAKLKVWQECGFAPFRRRRPQWTKARHGHICVIGCDHIDPMAARQVTDYHNGRNGLASHAAYDGPIEADRTWQRAQVVYADLIEEMDLMDAATRRELAKAVADELGSNNDFKTKVAMSTRTEVMKARVGTGPLKNWTVGHLIDYTARASKVQGDVLNKLATMVAQLSAGQKVAQADLDAVQAALDELTDEDDDPTEPPA